MLLLLLLMLLLQVVGMLAKPLSMYCVVNVLYVSQSCFTFVKDGTFTTLAMALGARRCFARSKVA